MAKLVLDLVDERELILEKDKTGTVKISYRTTSQSEVEIGSLSYSDISLIKSFLEIQQFASVGPPPFMPQLQKSENFLEKAYKLGEKYLKLLEKRSAESLGSIKEEQRKVK